MKYRKSSKLNDVCYDIRGPVMEEAKRLEEEGIHVLKLNIGNPAHFGLDAPEELLHDVVVNIQSAQGYCDSKGLFSARQAVRQYYQERGVEGVSIDDIYIGNGVSELISLSMNALLDNRDEVLIPAPDYPLWTASVRLSGGKPVHYRCDEESDWYPDVSDIRKKITNKTKALVVISPNNPTGAVYPKEVLQELVKLAEEHDLLLYSDEIYDRVLYDGRESVSLASLSKEVPVITFSGLSKVYRAAGFRTGWMMISGKKGMIADYIEGIEMLSNMRLCSNVPTQYAVQGALGGIQSIDGLVSNEGKLTQQRDTAWKGLNDIPGISCVKPGGAFYCFPKIDREKIHVSDDEQMIMDLLKEKRVHVVQGTGFNLEEPDHFRLVFLPEQTLLEDAVNRIRDFFASYSQ